MYTFIRVTATVNLYYLYGINKMADLITPTIRIWGQNSSATAPMNVKSSTKVLLKPIRDNQVIRVAWNSLFFEFNIEGNYKLCR